jgi:cyclic pyranopterin phosphate synthase
MADELTHLDESGRLRMVDVAAKDETERYAVARGEIRMRPETVRLVAAGRIPKGSVLEAARLAGILAAKRTAELIPLCHPLALTSVDLDFAVDEDRVRVEARAGVRGRTGVEMEVLTAACVALLTVYDMCKAADRGMVISEVRLVEKAGGASGTYVRAGEP